MTQLIKCSYLKHTGSRRAGLPVMVVDIYMKFAALMRTLVIVEMGLGINAFVLGEKAHLQVFFNALNEDYNILSTEALRIGKDLYQM
ncbi:hypothetical protein ACTXT7_010068 [Hymenolepis weldensis]